MRKRLTALLSMVVMTVLLAPGVALADTVIDTTPQWDGQEVIWPFGHPNTATVGQVITAPANDTQLENFTFFMRQPDTVTFRGEVYAWDGQKATGPNLYESVPRTTAGLGNFEFEDITFDTDGVQLTPGKQYVLFATISKDYEASNGRGEWGAVSYDAATYAGGTLTFMNNGPFFDQLFTNAWVQFFDYDLAFKAVFSSPAPTTKADCKKGGYKEFGFKNQGQCIKAVNHASK